MKNEKHITLEQQSFNLSEVKRLYPAALVKTGYEEEVTEMSLEWVDTTAKEGIEVTGYGIFIIMNESKQKFSFFYDTREALDNAMGKLAKQVG